jgi:hypothetical protein
MIGQVVQAAVTGTPGTAAKLFMPSISVNFRKPSPSQLRIN